MDIATILGVISAFGLVWIAIFMGGGIQLFINIPALMIVVGGTLGATMINYPLPNSSRDLWHLPRSLGRKAFWPWRPR
jgi:chemotaxis protein MotA